MHITRHGAERYHSETNMVPKCRPWAHWDSHSGLITLHGHGHDPHAVNVRYSYTVALDLRDFASVLDLVARQAVPDGALRVRRAIASRVSSIHQLLLCANGFAVKRIARLRSTPSGSKSRRRSR